MTRRERVQAATTADLLRIIPLFQAATKKELIKYCHDLEITDRGLTALILNADMAGFSHARAHWEWVPPHLALTKEVVRKIQESKGADRLRIFRKIIPAFKERRLFTGHLFYASNQWHLFFHDQRDREKEANHWRHGPHIHFLNHLVRPDMSLQQVGTELDTARPRIKSQIHIRYRELTEEDLRREAAQNTDAE
jgi:hypothetical protein